MGLSDLPLLGLGDGVHATGDRVYYLNDLLGLKLLRALQSRDKEHALTNFPVPAHIYALQTDYVLQIVRIPQRR